jgi:NitT/TauT family transport system ATP-binding protein
MLDIYDYNHSFQLADKSKKILFQNFSILFRSGITSIIGKNGVGKSTLFQSIVKSYINQQSTSDNDTIKFAKGATLKLVHQNPILSTLGWYNSIDNLKIIDSFTDGVLSEDAIQNYINNIESFGINPYFNLGSLSGGQLQIINILKSIAISPNILLLDEPFGALDIENSIRIKKLLKHWQSKTKATVVLISHSIEDLVELSDKAIFIDGTPVQIVNIIHKEEISRSGKSIINKFYE